MLAIENCLFSKHCMWHRKRKGVVSLTINRQHGSAPPTGGGYSVGYIVLVHHTHTPSRGIHIHGWGSVGLGLLWNIGLKVKEKIYMYYEFRFYILKIKIISRNKVWYGKDDTIHSFYRKLNLKYKCKFWIQCTQRWLY